MSKYGRQSNVVLVFDPSGSVLALRRSQTDPWRPGHWNFPGGRRDDTDRTAQEGAARELREEAGIHIDPRSLNWAFSYRHPGLINVFWVKLPFRPKVSHPDGEHDAHVWAKMWQIPQPSIHHVRYIVEQITGKTWNLAPVGSTPSGPPPLYGSPGTGETPIGGRNMSSKWNESDYLAYWPKYLPFPYAIKRGARPVPNVNSVDWPQAQFAPPYLPPGSPSFQPYSYFKDDVPLASQQPHYTTVNYGPYRQSGVGRGGDLARLPLGYGATMLFNPSSVSFTDEERGYTASLPPVNTKLPSGNHASTGLGRAKLRKIARAIRKLRRKQRKRPTQRRARLIKQYVLMFRALKAELQIPMKAQDFDGPQRRAKARLASKFTAGRRRRRRRRAKQRKANYIEQQALAVEAAGTLPAPSLAMPVTTTKWGMSATSTPIAAGIPSTAPAPVPEPIATAGLGDGFAYELAPLQASAPYAGYGDLALENTGDCGCHAQSNPGWFTDDEGDIQWGAVLAVAGVAGVAYWVGTEGMTKPLFA